MPVERPVGIKFADLRWRYGLALLTMWDGTLSSVRPSWPITIYILPSFLNSLLCGYPSLSFMCRARNYSPQHFIASGKDSFNFPTAITMIKILIKNSFRFLKGTERSQFSVNIHLPVNNKGWDLYYPIACQVCLKHWLRTLLNFYNPAIHHV